MSAISHDKCNNQPNDCFAAFGKMATAEQKLIRSKNTTRFQGKRSRHSYFESDVQ